MTRPVLYVLAGVNGAGKSSIGGHLLERDGLTWFNPDTFAREFKAATGCDQETANAHAFRRCIYIHGTNEENLIGRPASFGCIRMKSSDIAALYSQLPLGAPVEIVQERLPKASNMADPEVYGFDAPASKSGLRRTRRKRRRSAESRGATDRSREFMEARR